MEGHGVTNYNVDRPSYGYTTSTTQFDDALLQHGVVNRTQTIVAKGATVAQAQALLVHERRQQATAQEQARHLHKPWYSDSIDNHCGTAGSGTDSDGDKGDDSDYDDLLNDDTDEVLQRYHQLRLQEYQQDYTKAGVQSISRDDWTVKVNQASREGKPVLVCLTTTSANVEFLQACTILAQRHGSCAFVSLPAPEALRDWPHPEPSILVYCQGSLWREFFRLTAWSVEDLERTLSNVWDMAG